MHTLELPNTTMTTDYRALCAELAGWIERSTRHYIQDPDVLIRAYAALDEPEPEVVGPTDKELLALVPQGSESDFYLPQGLPSDWVDGDFIAPPGAVLAFARAVLARWGHQPAPPAEAEVGELAVFLRGCAEDHYGQGRRQFTRAADLLEQRHPAPVPVSERLPGPDDCDAEGRCWFWRTDGADEFWEFVVPLSNIHEFNLTAQWRYAHWLPAKALPLPQGEVER